LFIYGTPKKELFLQQSSFRENVKYLKTIKNFLYNTWPHNSQDSIVVMLTNLWVGKLSEPHCSVSKPALRPNQPSIFWVMEIPSPGVKRPGREADHSVSYSAKAEGVKLYLHFRKVIMSCIIIIIIIINHHHLVVCLTRP